MPVTVRTPAVSTCLLSVTVNDPRLITVLGAGLRISGMGGKNGRSGAKIEPAWMVASPNAGPPKRLSRHVDETMEALSCSTCDSPYTFTAPTWEYACSGLARSRIPPVGRMRGHTTG